MEWNDRTNAIHQHSRYERESFIFWGCKFLEIFSFHCILQSTITNIHGQGNTYSRTEWQSRIEHSRTVQPSLMCARVPVSLFMPCPTKPEIYFSIYFSIYTKFSCGCDMKVTSIKKYEEERTSLLEQFLGDKILAMRNLLYIRNVPLSVCMKGRESSTCISTVRQSMRNHCG